MFFAQVPPQEMLSRDSVTVSVDAVCFYKVNTLFSMGGSVYKVYLMISYQTYTVQNID